MIEHEPQQRPILFSPPMVRALLDGRKTQTRRIVKPSKGWEKHSVCKPSGAADPWAVWWHYPETDRVGHLQACPYGIPGDTMWVRETWRVGNRHDGFNADEIWESLKRKQQGVTVLYEAGGWKSVAPISRPEPVYSEKEPMPSWAGRKRSAFYMPRWAARIILEIKSVRVERLQDISEDDAIAEGVEEVSQGVVAGWKSYAKGDMDDVMMFPRSSFRTLWESLHGPDAWEQDPFVWRISFHRVLDAAMERQAGDETNQAEQTL